MEDHLIRPPGEGDVFEEKDRRRARRNHCEPGKPQKQQVYHSRQLWKARPASDHSEGPLHLESASRVTCRRKRGRTGDPGGSAYVRGDVAGALRRSRCQLHHDELFKPPARRPQFLTGRKRAETDRRLMMSGQGKSADQLNFQVCAGNRKWFPSDRLRAGLSAPIQGSFLRALYPAASVWDHPAGSAGTRSARPTR